MKISIRTSQMRVSQRPEDLLVAQDVGTGMSIAIHDPILHIGGILHMMLPDSSVYPELADKNPLMFTDTAIPVLLEAAREQGAKSERLNVHIAGGADLLPKGPALFSVGQQNIQKSVEILKSNRLQPENISVGGKKTRSMFLNVGTGKSWVDAN